MILGFTGTRNGMTAYQKAAFERAVAAFPERAIHGGAVGADEEFNEMMGSGLICPVEVYPTEDRYRFWKDKQVSQKADRELIVHSPQLPLVRNRVIVSRIDHLLAAPSISYEVRRSGTWATVRYARAARRPITILLPWAVPWSETGIIEEHGRG